MNDSPPPWRTMAAARWITSPVLGGPRTLPPAVYCRREFELPSAPAGAVWLHATALGLFEIEINGRCVGGNVLAPGWTDYRKRVYYHSHEVGGLLRAGANTVGAVLGSGWHSGHIACHDRQFYGEHPALLLSIETESETLAATDAGWHWATGPILENDLLMGEAYDARRELGAWTQPGFAAAAWRAVELREAPAIAVERSPAPPVRRTEQLPGVFLADRPYCPVRGHRRIVDFGQNIAGRVRLRVRGSAGATVRIRHGEFLQPDGEVYFANLRTARATDLYTLRGGGVEEWEPRFTFHGFRYAEIASLQPVEVLSAGGMVLHSDCAATGEFDCSHPLLNQLARNIVRSQKGNFLDIPTDCPQRDERLGWTGDAQVFVRTAAFFMDVRGFFQKWLRDLRDAQPPSGAVPPTIPFTGAFGLGDDGGPAWADATFICPWTIYQCYGDVDLLREHYPSMTGYLEYLAAHRVKDHIRCHPDLGGWMGFGDWLALDGSGRTEGGTPADLIGTAFYAHGADLTARTAALLGKEEDAARHRRLHENIRGAFQRRFTTPDGGVIGGTQTGYVLALHFGLLPAAARPAAARELVRLIERNGWRIGTGFVGTPYLLHVLEAHGHLDVAYRLLEQEAFPSWLFPVKNGATTIWERWDGWTPDKGFQDVGMNSFNHYAYGAVGDWMVSTVAGLDLLEPGYRHIHFKPRPGGTLTHARAALQTRHGKVSVAWTLADGILEVTAGVPAGCRATLTLPESCGVQPEALGPGTHVRRARTGPVREP